MRSPFTDRIFSRENDGRDRKCLLSNWLDLREVVMVRHCFAILAGMFSHPCLHLVALALRPDRHSATPAFAGCGGRIHSLKVVTVQPQEARRHTKVSMQQKSQNRPPNDHLSLLFSPIGVQKTSKKPAFFVLF